LSYMFSALQRRARARFCGPTALCMSAVRVKPCSLCVAARKLRFTHIACFRARIQSVLLRVYSLKHALAREQWYMMGNRYKGCSTRQVCVPREQYAPDRYATVDVNAFTTLLLTECMKQMAKPYTTAMVWSCTKRPNLPTPCSRARLFSELRQNPDCLTSSSASASLCLSRSHARALALSEFSCVPPGRGIARRTPRPGISPPGRTPAGLSQ